jgi:sugar phosphate isomerase/epimerase
MKLSIVSDELKIPQAEAFEMISQWGFRNVELRSATGGRFPDGNLDELERLIAEHTMTVTALSPGVFKCGPEADALHTDLERLGRTLDTCERFGTKLIIVFPIHNPGWDEDNPADGEITDTVVNAMREAGRMAADHGVRLAIENEPAYTAVTAGGLARLIDAVGMDNIGGNWDPGNAYPWDQEIVRGPEILGDRIFNVHVKDCWVRDNERGFDSVGNGDIDWKAQVDGLTKLGYDGAIVVETHCQPGVEKSKENTDSLKAIVGV